jgi:hypothetical protein
MKNVVNDAGFRCVILDIFLLLKGWFAVEDLIGIALGSISAFACVEINCLERRRIMGGQQKHIKGLALLGLIMFGALSIMVTGCGDSGDGNGTTLTQQTLVASWGIRASHGQDITQSGTISLKDEGALTYELVQLNLNPPGLKPMILIGTGTWTFDGSSLTMTFDTGVVDQGTPQGNSTEFSMVCANGWTLNFSRK